MINKYKTRLIECLKYSCIINRVDKSILYLRYLLYNQKKYNVVGAHLFVLDKDKKVTAFCRNIAPLVGIDEECATGTSNGALTNYLKDYNIITTQDINTFIQGESMDKLSTVFSRYKENQKTIQIGGNAAIFFECKIYK